jgi:hypothetical protein
VRVEMARGGGAREERGEVAGHAGGGRHERRLAAGAQTATGREARGFPLPFVLFPFFTLHLDFLLFKRVCISNSLGHLKW